MIEWFILSLATLVTAIAAAQLFVSLSRYRLKDYSYPDLAEDDSPTVSVCVPARNETYSLADCLQSVLASDYEKLEIIVLDDCSQDKTSNIIKSFAHDGVRFIQGDTPAEGWLGKNYASETLASTANGEFILFMGVDTRIEPHTISELVNYTLLKHVSMVSVLPRRRDSGWRTSVFLSPLRYFIQMAIPQFIHTPSSSALWLIDRQALQKVGGFFKVRNQIAPEGILARIFDTRGTYRYIISTDKLGAFYAKKWQSQVDTSIRLSYPALKKQPLLVVSVAILIYLLFILPYVLVVTALLTNAWDGQSLVSGGLVVAYFLLYLLYTRRVWRHGWLLGAFVFPYIILQEVTLILASMFAYLFGRVDWKGRNICYPVLRRSK
ncbi:glycosyl transferase, family 2 [candidate division TM7 genomosp. GTL1]|nr:glycosyl transferase, family 2 [candidate division TM7 genomosp. GTL1]